MLVIRDYLDRDLNQVVELWYRSWAHEFPNLKHPQSFGEWKLRFQNDLAKRGNVLVAVIRHRIVGFVVAIEGKINQIFVDIDIQRNGTGTALIDRVKKIYPSGLRLTVLQQNTKARKFYEKHGFVAGKLGVNKINRQPNIEYIWYPENTTV